MEKKIISVVGPTCVGKTKFAINLAKKYKTEIISFDSRQFYKELKIGSCMPLESEMKEIKHHFINNKSIKENYNAGSFAKEAQMKIKTLFKNYSVIILVGGSGLYEKAITEGLDEIPKISLEIRKKINNAYYQFGLKFLQEELKKKDEKYFLKVDINNPHRLIRALEIIEVTGKSILYYQNKKKKKLFKTQRIGLYLPREEHYNQINQRVDTMIKNGFIDEVKKLINYKNYSVLKTVGYSEIFNYLDNNNYNSLDFYIEQIKKNTKKYAKKQITWFKKNTKTIWVNPNYYTF